MRNYLAVCTAVFFLFGCADGGSTQNAGSHYYYTFAVDTEGWSGGFSDYPKDEEEAYALHFSHSPLPAPLNEAEGSVRISGNNLGSELFMYMKTKLTSLDANATYRVQFSVAFASNAAGKTNGTMENKGHSVLIKAGALSREPLSQTGGNGIVQMNIDKGNQYGSGADMKVIGNFSNGTNEDVYHLKTVGNSTSMQAHTDENGTLWLIVGTDSGFDGSTTVYYNTVTVDLTKQ